MLAMNHQVNAAVRGVEVSLGCRSGETVMTCSRFNLLKRSVICLLLLSCLYSISPGFALAGTVVLDEPARQAKQSFLKSLYEGPEAARNLSRFKEPGFVEHAPASASGCLSVSVKPGNQPVYVIDNLIKDGDLAAVHYHTFSGRGDRGTVCVDIWRFRVGKVLEHWRVAQPVPETIRHDNTMWCGRGNDYSSAAGLTDTLSQPACAPPDPDTDRARTLEVVNAYREELGASDVAGAIKRWFSPDYSQHSPHIADGIQGAIEYLNTEFGRSDAVKPRAEVLNVIAQGDLVLYRRHVWRPAEDNRESFNIDIFRVTDGLISEHWDVKSNPR